MISEIEYYFRKDITLKELEETVERFKQKFPGSEVTINFKHHKIVIKPKKVIE